MTHRSAAWAVALGVALTSLVPTRGADPAPEAAAAVTTDGAAAGDRLLVTLAAADGLDADAVVGAGGEVVSSTGRVAVVAPDHGEDPDRLAAALGRLPGVVAVERDVTVRPATFDPGYPQQWALENVGQSVSGRIGTRGEDADVPDGWRFSRGTGALVAIVDGAVDTTHEDLVGAFWRNPDETRNGRDDDGNGWVDDVQGIDLTDRDANVRAGDLEERHGTELAGVVAARTDNGIGVAGAAPRAQLLPVRFIADGVGLLSDAIEGLGYAVGEGADVVVLSWVGAEQVRALRTAIEDAGVPVVVPAGNDRTTLVGGGVDVPNLVVVAALDNRGQLPTFTNRGRGAVDLLAPGWQLLTTTSADGYARVSGTSLAAAFVGASLAMGTQVAPAGTTSDELVATLLASTRPTTRWRPSVATGGTLDHEAFAAAVVFTRRAGVCPREIDTAALPVDAGSVHADGVACMLELELAAGFPDGTFRPTQALSRGQIATLLVGLLRVRGEDLPVDAPDAFGDDDGTPHEQDIDVLAALDLVAGRADGGYHPADAVRRDELASLLDRVFGREVPDVAAPSRDWFDDDDGSVHERAIDRLRDLGLVRGTGRTTYAPAASVTRGQAASMVAATLDRITRERALD